MATVDTQEENGGAKRRYSLLGFYVLIHLATAIYKKVCFKC